MHDSQHWKPLLLATHFNLESEEYYKMLQGDKDTFQFAWRALLSPFTMIPIATGTGGYTIPRTPKNPPLGGTGSTPPIHMWSHMTMRVPLLTAA